MFQEATVTGYRDFANRLVELATSKHISALAVNAGGTGYVTGDILQISHAGATLPCTFVITATAGAVTSIQRIRNGGAFSNRVATVTRNAAGTGYAVNDVVRLTTGTFTQAAKARVTVIGGGGSVTTAVLFEAGGAYSSVPTATGGATNSDIGTGVGTGLTLDTTMTGLIGTTGAASTAITGVGTGATFNLTLTDTGWLCRDDRNDYSHNSVLDEKEVILEGNSGGSEETPIIGFRTGTNGSGLTLRHYLIFTAFTAWSSSTPYDSQPNAINPAPSTTAGTYIGFVPTDTTVVSWFTINGRRLAGITRADGTTVTAYHQFYVGLGKPFGTATENPYAMLVMGSISGEAISAESATQIDITSLTECYRHTSRTGPHFAWKQATLTWLPLINGQGTGAPPFVAQQAQGVFPIFEPDQTVAPTDPDRLVDDGPLTFFNDICRSDGGTAATLLKPTPNTAGDLFSLIPATVIFSDDGYIQCELDNVYWVSAVQTSGASIAPEDTFTLGTDVYRAFPSGSRTTQYSFMAIKEGY